MVNKNSRNLKSFQFDSGITPSTPIPVDSGLFKTVEELLNSEKYLVVHNLQNVNLQDFEGMSF